MTIIGSDPVFLDLMDQVSQVAGLDRPILIIGERGTGKEMVAARLHFLSRRWGQAFVKLNCAALPETLIDSELFGVEPGAFTGAAKRRAGRFERADGGSLFLDEIASLSAEAQERLLRIIEYGEYERLGGTRTLSTDVRVIGAANVDLPAMADRGAFRADLLDRLAFDVLTIPPLRARPDDIPQLVDHFGRSMAVELNWPGFLGFSDRAMGRLRDYQWPGNIRELKNVVERAVYRWPDPDKAVDEVIFDPFASPYRPHKRGKSKEEKTLAGKESGNAEDQPLQLPCDFRALISDHEKDLLQKALSACRYNQRETAAALGLSYDQLRHAAKKHNLL